MTGRATAFPGSPREQDHVLVSGGTVVTMDPQRRIVEGDVLIANGEIKAVGKADPPPATRLIDAKGKHVFPGFIQAHVHLGQSLFKGMAEGLPLLSWLRDRIWPLEAAHTAESAYWSAMLGAADCVLSGTTTIQDIGLPTHSGEIFRAVRDSGLRALAGKCLMDSGDGVPPELCGDTREIMEEVRELHAEWHGAAGGRIQTVLAPRFLLSGSRKLWEEVVRTASELKVPVHTHLLESQDEAQAAQDALGMGQMDFMHGAGVLDTPLCIAHGVWFDESASKVLDGRPMGIAHCPTSNLKLGSGIADLVFLKSQANLRVGLGADGAPCNNDLDIVEEMRLAALLQQWKNGPGAFTARDALELATIGGAQAIGLEDAIGSLEPGKRGDVVIVDLNRPGAFAGDGASVYDRLVYGASRGDVKWVLVDGEVVVRQGELVHTELAEILARSREEARMLLERSHVRI